MALQLVSWLTTPLKYNHRTCTFIHSFILAISVAPLQVLYYSEALPTTARIRIGVSRQSAQAGAHQAYSKQAVSSRSATHLAAEGMRCNDCPIYHSADK